MSRAWALLAAAWLLGSGCRSYSDLAVDAIYRDALRWDGRDDAAATRRPSEPLWRGVDSRKTLTLGDAFKISLTQSERIARAAEGFIQSLAVKDQMVAAILPTVNVLGTQYFQERVPASITSGIVTTSASNRQLAVNLSQPIFHGLRELAAWKQAQYSSEQARSFFDTERRLIFQIVAQSFMSTLFYERQQRVLEDAVRNSRDRLREMKARQEQGIARKTEVLLIETQVASDEAQLNRARQSLDLSRTQMTFILGRPLEHPLSDDVVEPAVIPPDPEPMLQQAMAARSDLRERQAALLASEQAIDVVTGEHLPTLDLSANYYLYRERYSDYQSEIHWDALLSLTFNLFKGGDIRARTIVAESQSRVARLNRDELVRQIETEVRSALLTWRLDRELIGTLETRERTSRENYTQVVSEYRQGIAGVSNLEVLVAQNQYFSAQLELERSRLQSKLDWFQLENALGRIPLGVP